MCPRYGFDAPLRFGKFELVKTLKFDAQPAEDARIFDLEVAEQPLAPFAVGLCCLRDTQAGNGVARMITIAALHPMNSVTSTASSRTGIATI
jgi:hypothetical protein